MGDAGQGIGEQRGGRDEDENPRASSWRVIFVVFRWVILVVVVATVPLALLADYLQKAFDLTGSPQLALPGVMTLVLTAGHTAPKTVKTFGLVVIVGVAAGSLGVLICALVLGISDGFWFYVLGVGLAACVTVPTTFLAFRWLGVLSWNIPTEHRS